MTSPFPPSEGRNFYGRIKGKTLRPTQKIRLREDLAPLRLRNVSEDDNPDRSQRGGRGISDQLLRWIA